MMVMADGERKKIKAETMSLFWSKNCQKDC